MKWGVYVLISDKGPVFCFASEGRIKIWFDKKTQFRAQLFGYSMVCYVKKPHSLHARERAEREVELKGCEISNTGSCIEIIKKFCFLMWGFTCSFK